MAASPAGNYAASIPALMRGARGSYKRGVEAELAARGITDLPRGGGFVLASLSTGSEAVEDFVRGLGVTKQAFSQLTETLVSRGYVVREQHPADRRRLVLRLTARGRDAAEAVVAGAQDVDDQLRQRLSKTELAALRKGLAALAEIKAAYGGPS
ncbi:MAG TPA: MarR family transcriptional regulator [Mycobacteriales bacterium]|nr:MarR family transcriptional regulator [Mycobacteriales bacterium]